MLANQEFDTPGDAILAHYGVKGMRWGHVDNSPEALERRSRNRKIALGAAFVGLYAVGYAANRQANLNAPAWRRNFARGGLKVKGYKGVVSAPGNVATGVRVVTGSTRNVGRSGGALTTTALRGTGAAGRKAANGARFIARRGR